jgi:ElaB/YqjD/DUF883 family membrane-anchored ribosome-binding protein
MNFEPEESEPSTIRENIEDTRRELRSDVDSLTARVDPTMAVRRGGRRMGDLVRTARERVMGTAGDTVDRVSDVGSTATESIADATRDVGRSVRRRSQGHPLAAGAVAFGAGLLASALLPPSDRERRLGRRAGELAAAQVAPLAEQAGDLTSDAVSNLREPAEQAVTTVRSSARDATGAVEEQARTSAERLHPDNGVHS